MKRIFQCDYCGKEIISRDSREYKHHFCNIEHKGKWSSLHRVGKNAANWQGGGIEVECHVCGKKKEIEKWHYDRNTKDPTYKGIFLCSLGCESKYRSMLTGENSTHWQGGGIEVKCKNCGKVKVVGKSEYSKRNMFFCNNDCRWKYEVGENHHCWIGGDVEYGVEFNEVLKEYIREYDGYKCAICNKEQNGEKLAVHHIDYDKKNNSERNLITLCRSCHAKTNFNRNYWIDYFKPIMRLKYPFRRIPVDGAAIEGSERVG